MADPDIGLAARLAWLQVQDSAFPAGRFVHSNGLEAWLAGRPSATEDEIAALVRAYVARSVATLDAVVLAHAWSCATPGELATLDQLLTTYKPAASARVASERSGGNLATVALRTVPREELSATAVRYLTLVAQRECPGNQAVVEGALQAALCIPRADAVAGFLRSAEAGMLSAAVRLGVLGSIAAQRIQLADRHVVAGLARTSECTPLDELSAFTPELELSAMQHESVAGRLFTT